MARPIADKHEELIQDTLARIGGLGISDRSVEEGAKVPQGFLGKSRKGKNRAPTAAPSWAALRAWLLTQGAVGRGMEPPAAPAPIDQETEAKKPTKVSLADQIAAIGTSARRHRKAMQSLAIATILGTFEDHKDAELALHTLKAMKDSIKLEKFEAAQEKVGDLEIMTEDEVEDFRQWQASRAPRGLEPGEAPKPPEKTSPEKKL